MHPVNKWSCLLLALALSIGIFAARPAQAQTGPAYNILINTSGIASTVGYVEYGFDPSAPDSPAATVNMSYISYAGGYTVGAATLSGLSSYTPGTQPVTGDTASITNGQATSNNILLPVTFGNQLSLNAAFFGPAFASNAPDGSDFYIYLLDGSGNPLLTNDPFGTVFDLQVNGNGSVTPLTFSPNVVTYNLVPETNGGILLFVGLAAFGLMFVARKRSAVKYAFGVRSPQSVIKIGAALAIAAVAVVVCAAPKAAMAQAGTHGTLANNYEPWPYTTPASAAALALWGPSAATTGESLGSGVPADMNAPIIGSKNIAIDHPSIAVPPTTPIMVPLCVNDQHGDYSVHTYPYSNSAPALANETYYSYPGAPAGGPWAKIVLVMDIVISPMTQFDRSWFMWMGGCQIALGTTEEPSASAGQPGTPSWEVQRDVTEYQAVLDFPQPFGIYLGNTISSPYLAYQYLTAYLLFYPTDANDPAATYPNVIISQGFGSIGTLNEGGLAGFTTDEQGLVPNNTNGSGNVPPLAPTTFPTNIVKAYAEPWGEAQIDDEFFWEDTFKTPYTVGASNGPDMGMREMEMQVDGQTVGQAACMPILYGGGGGPADWEPQPFIEMYNFYPKRVDLSPMAAYLSNGQPHLIEFPLYYAEDYWNTGLNVFMYTDPYLSQVQGGLVTQTNTLPSPTFVGTGTKPTMTSNESGTLDGYVLTYQGWQENKSVVTDTYMDNGEATMTDNRNSTYTTNALFATSDLVQNWVRNWTFTSSAEHATEGWSVSDTYNGSPYFSASSTDTMAASSSSTSNHTFAYTDSIGNSWNENVQSGTYAGPPSVTKAITVVTYGAGDNLTNSFWANGVGGLIPNDWILVTN